MDVHMLATGDIVKLKKPYRPGDFPQAKNSDWKGFGYGIVAEILTTQMIVNGDRYGDEHPRNVSLNLYDATGQMMIEPSFIEAGLCIPSYVDFHVSELELYKIASESGYIPVPNPPDWEKVWTQEKAVLSEFTAQ
ncbi:MAG: hypothetical protein WA947_08195 [Phormidesmis sp.]